MTTLGSRAPALLFLGDITAFAVALFVTLWIRYADFPTMETLSPYLIPFAFLFVLWSLIFFMSGLYGKRLALFPSRVPDALLRTQFVNIILSALFFFFIPIFGIAPKTILALYLVVSLFVIYIWRLSLYPRLASRRVSVRAALIAEGEEARELEHEVNGNPRYGVTFVYTASPKEFAPERLAEAKVALVVADTTHPDVTAFSPLVQAVTIGSDYQFAEFADFYEEKFDRIPLSRLTDAWFLKYVQPKSGFYSLVKRCIDIAGALVMGVLTIVLAPFIWIALQIEGRGSLFIHQIRIGRKDTRINTLKFRSMLRSDSGMWVGEGENRVTKVGAFLRKISLDEFPQFVNILKGELSLIGPRNDVENLGKRLAEAIPYYNARYSVKPGITGWAQINQQYEQNNISPQSIKETKTRLAYDFYYLKHRSLGLDIVIALKTVKRMFFRVSSW